MTADELASLEKCLLSAVDGRCIPDWELEALLGCTRGEARERIVAGLAADRGDELLLDQAVILLSALSGSAQLSSRGRSLRQRVELPELHMLLARLMGADAPTSGPRPEHQPERESAVTLRVPAGARAEARVSTKTPKKRRA